MKLPQKWICIFTRQQKKCFLLLLHALERYEEFRVCLGGFIRRFLLPSTQTRSADNLSEDTGNDLREIAHVIHINSSFEYHECI